MNDLFVQDKIDKFADWAKSLSDDVDFIDYWYNLFLSQTKERIESNPLNNINAFWWTRWKEDFEEFVDKYKPITGNGFDADIRYWFASCMQEAVNRLDISSKEIAQRYGKDSFAYMINFWHHYQPMFGEEFVNKFVNQGWEH